MALLMLFTGIAHARADEAIEGIAITGPKNGPLLQVAIARISRPGPWPRGQPQDGPPGRRREP